MLRIWLKQWLPRRNRACPWQARATRLIRECERLERRMQKTVRRQWS